MPILNADKTYNYKRYVDIKIVVWNKLQLARGVQQTTKGVLKFATHHQQKGAIIVTKELVDNYPIDCNKSQFKD